MKEQFVDHKFNRASLELVGTANDILVEYARQGYRLSLRQLYYQLVARDYIENTVKSYKRIGSLVSDARLAGMLDWDMIEDRNRETVFAHSMGFARADRPGGCGTVPGRPLARAKLPRRGDG